MTIPESPSKVVVNRFEVDVALPHDPHLGADPVQVVVGGLDAYLRCSVVTSWLPGSPSTAVENPAGFMPTCG